MTLASTIIEDAFRENNIIAIGATPTSAEYDEGLRRLNGILSSVFGFEVGEEFTDLALGNDGRNYDLPFEADPWNLNKPFTNTRMIANNEEALTVYLPPRPNDGSRIAIVDPLSNLATYPVTLDGNGRAIEGSATLVLNTADLNRSWMYRADLAEWVRMTDLTDITDEMPFPAEFDDYFVCELSMRLNTRNGRATPPETSRTAARVKSLLQARYRQRREMVVEKGLWITPWRLFGTFNTGEF